MSNKFINCAIRVCVSDPWEFYDDNSNSGTVEGIILDIRNDCLLFQLLNTVKLRKGGQPRDYCKFIAFPMDQSISMTVDLPSAIPCSVYALDGRIDTIEEAKLFVSKWRGGAVCTCDISVVVQRVSSDPNPQFSDAISGEKPESEYFDTKKSVDCLD